LVFFSAAHTLLLAHGKAWHVYDREFRKTQKGRISIVLNADWHFPQENKEVFIKAAKRGMEFFLGWFANPIYVNGDYPEVMKTLIAEHSKLEGVPNRYLESILSLPTNQHTLLQCRYKIHTDRCMMYV
jgi:lactase-phlorizin hydrolase